MKQVEVPTVSPSDDGDDMLDEYMMIRDDSAPHNGMDVNIFFILPLEFRAIDEKVSQLNLDSKEAIFESLKNRANT